MPGTETGRVVTRVLSFTAMTKRFRKPRIKKFGDVSRWTRQQPQGFDPKGEDIQLQGNGYESI